MQFSLESDTHIILGCLALSSLVSMGVDDVEDLHVNVGTTLLDSGPGAIAVLLFSSLSAPRLYAYRTCIQLPYRREKYCFTGKTSCCTYVKPLGIHEMDRFSKVALS